MHRLQHSAPGKSGKEQSGMKLRCLLAAAACAALFCGAATPQAPPVRQGVYYKIEVRNRDAVLLQMCDNVPQRVIARRHMGPGPPGEG